MKGVKGELEPGDRMEVYLERIEQDLLRSALAIKRNNQTRAAQQLGISRSGLIKKLKRMPIDWCINIPEMAHLCTRRVFVNQS